MTTLVRGRFRTGAKPSPRHKLLAARPFRPFFAPPPEFAVVPKTLRFWGNDQEGDCVSAEEAFAKAWWAAYCGLPDLAATDDEVMRFAARYGYANGASLTEVMDTMAQAGMSIGGRVYKDGGYAGVDYSNEATLQAALCQGPVKVAIDHNALPPTAGQQQGWFSTDGGSFTDTDHCVGLAGYGTAKFLFGKLGLPVPAGLNPDTFGYLLFTWSSLGFVTHDWIMGTVVEAWLRTPTTVGQSPAPQPAPSPPTPTPVPPPAPVKPTTFSVTLSGHVPTFGGAVTLTGTATEQASPAPHFHATPDASPALPAALIPEITALIADLKAGNYFAVIADVEAILADPSLTKAVAVVRLVIADVRAGKTIQQTVADVVALLAA